jgi:methionyl-tRNA formyltransferase
VGLKLWRATVVQQRADEPRAAPGTVLAADGREGLVIQAGEGAVRLVEVQPVGRRSMSGAAFVRGRGIGAGEVLGGG